MFRTLRSTIFSFYKSRDAHKVMGICTRVDLGMSNFTGKHFKKGALSNMPVIQVSGCFFCHIAGLVEILDLLPGIEPRPTAVKAPSPNHWTTKQSLGF